MRAAMQTSGCGILEIAQRFNAGVEKKEKNKSGRTKEGSVVPDGTRGNWVPEVQR